MTTTLELPPADVHALAAFHDLGIPPLLAGSVVFAALSARRAALTAYARLFEEQLAAGWLYHTPRTMAEALRHIHAERVRTQAWRAVEDTTRTAAAAVRAEYGHRLPASAFPTSDR